MSYDVGVFFCLHKDLLLVFIGYYYCQSGPSSLVFGPLGILE
jgi:hypothetical protein